MRTKHWILLAIALQIAIIAGMVAKSLYPLVSGREVLLRVTARDPRDIFRGNYVDLNYSFSRLKLSEIPNDFQDKEAQKFGDEAFVELEPKGDFYEPKGLWSFCKTDALCLRVLSASPAWRTDDTRNFRAGIESYFTDKERAESLEKIITGSNRDSVEVFARVMIASNGVARIKSLEYRMTR